MGYLLERLELVLGWPGVTAGLFCALTAMALGLLEKGKRDTLALWLMGAMPEESWHKTFLSMFDALFYGPNCSRMRFFLVSALVSTVAISTIWFLMYRAGNLRVEMGGVALWQAILIGIAINIVADYVSLLETRFLLSRMPRNALLQVLVLILDAVITGAIILTTIWLATQTGLVPQDRSDPLTVMLAFSIYSAPFYSTFLTSVWSWLYIGATLILKVFTRFRLSNWLDVENKPVLLLSLALSVFVWLGTLGVSLSLEKNPETQLSALDEFVCQTFKGEICLRMIGITEQEETQFLLRTRACEGGAGLSTCTQQAISQWEGTPERAAVLWRAVCSAGNAASCTYLGYLHKEGLGVDQDYAQARALYRQACDGGDSSGCTNLGVLYERGQGIDQDYAQARALYKQGCDEGNARGCTNLGFLYDEGLGVDQNYSRARALYTQGCDKGNALGCTNLGFLYERGDGVDQDYAQAQAFYKQGCDEGDALGCTNLGAVFRNGTGVPVDADKANELYGQACEMNGAKGCYYLGWNIRDGFGVEPDKAEALIYLRKGCDLGEANSCAAAERLAAD